MKTRVNIIFIIFLLFYGSNVFPQTIGELEGRLENFRHRFKTESSKLDSLKTVFDKRIEMIKSAKSKTDYDKEAVARIMAESIPISNEIDSLEKYTGVIKNNMEDIKRELSGRYESKIDSLRLIEKSGKLSGEKSDLIKSQIYYYTEKKILAGPQIALLSFNPEKIVKINLSSISDSVQKKIYAEYLTDAYREVNDRLKNVEESIGEVSSAITLQRKTAKFLEEAEFETGPPETINKTVPQSQSVLTGPDNVGPLPTTPGGGAVITQKSAYLSQAQNYNLLLWQLKQSSDSDIKLKTNNLKVSPNLTLPQYYQLLEELKNRLSDYKFILSHKIGISK